jgi:hypothetical protein
MVTEAERRLRARQYGLVRILQEVLVGEQVVSGRRVGCGQRVAQRRVVRLRRVVGHLSVHAYEKNRKKKKPNDFNCVYSIVTAQLFYLPIPPISVRVLLRNTLLIGNRKAVHKRVVFTLKCHVGTV